MVLLDATRIPISKNKDSEMLLFKSFFTFSFLITIFNIFIFFTETVYCSPAFAGPDSNNTGTSNFSQGLYLTFIHNPALTGINRLHNVQYEATAFPYIESFSQTILFDALSGKSKKHNFGAGLGKENNTYIKTRWGKFSYAYRFLRDNRLSIGFSCAFFSKRIFWERLTFGDMVDKRYGFIYDTKETIGTDSRSYIDFNTGLWYSGNKFYSGISILHITQPYEGFNTTNSYRLPAEMYLTGGYYFNFIRDNYLIPSLLLKHSYFSTSFSPTVLTSFHNKYFIGLTWRNLTVVSLDASIIALKRLRFFISCGIPTSRILWDARFISYFDASIRYQFGQNKVSSNR